MALTKTTKDVTDIPSVSVALKLDSTTNGIKEYIDTTKANINNPTFTGVINLPSAHGVCEVKAGTGDGASPTVYNTIVRGWWGIGFRDYTDDPTVKAYIDCRSGAIYGQTATAGTSTTQLATTAFVTDAVTAKANTDSATLTGVPKAPTAANGDNTTQIANTAFVQTAVANVTNTVPTFSGGVGGGEGGKIHLKKPITTGLAGDVIIDLSGNVIRFFEGGGAARGGYFDFTQLAAGAGTNLLTAGSASSFAAGTQIPFCQAAAPTGWTQNTSVNNRMLRVVNGGGGGVGGAHDPTVMNQVPNHTHSFTTDGNNRGHQHWTQTGANNVGHQHWVQTGTVSSDHTHDFGTSTNNNGNHQHSYAGTGYGAASGSNVGINAATVQNTSWAGDHNHNVSGTTGGIKANHTHNCWSDGINQNHSHNCWSDGENQNHTHTGWTAGNGGGNWSPLYIDMIFCIKQ